VLIVVAAAIAACSRPQPVPEPQPTHRQFPDAIAVSSPTPAAPNLQAELLTAENTTTDSPIGNFDFKNYTYELPRGWQNPDGTTEITLKDGHAAPVSTRQKSRWTKRQRRRQIAAADRAVVCYGEIL
jgi:hypothetical protein